MNIQELNLAAFGPFTDKSLIFNQEESGLHIIYGSNEAGKSSALRGLKALLYGIDGRTSDDFIHDKSKLLINGCLRNADGHELIFSRRKGNKNTLLNIDGIALDDQALTPFLQGVSPELFAMLFGIDHQSLLQGGQEILEQKGEVGQAIFSAAIGSHALHAILKQLDDEADQLFRPQGSKPIINAALQSYKKLEKEIKTDSLSSRIWDDHHRVLGKASSELIQVQAELSGNRAEINRLKRIKLLLPKFAQRSELLKDLESLNEVVILPEDFPERHQLAVKEIENSQAILGKSSPRLLSLQTDLDNLIVKQEVLDQSESIEDLYSRLGGNRKALQDRPRLEADRQLLLTDAESVLKVIGTDLDLNNIEKLLTLLTKRQSITALGNKKALLVSRVEQSEINKRENQTRLKGALIEQQSLPDMGVSDALRRTITAARKLGDIDTAIQSTQSDITSLKKQCAVDLSKLTLWNGALEDLQGLALPNRENINYFEQAYDDLDKELQPLQSNQEKIANELLDTSLRIDEIERAGTVPTEEALVDARSARDKVWQLLRRQWVHGEDISKEVKQLEIDDDLPDKFEERLAGADDLSDRLRREADRVHKIANLQASQASMKQQSIDLSQNIEVCIAKKNEITADWQALWAPCDIVPRTPREMRLWLDEAEKLREHVGEVIFHSGKMDELEQTRKSHIQSLKQQLMDLGQPASKSTPLELVLAECEESAQQIDEVKQKRDALDKEIKDLELKIETLSDEHQLASEELNAWIEEWRELIENSGLDGSSTPSKIDDVIENLREIVSKQSEAEKLYIRINAINDEAELFNSQVISLVASVTPEFKSFSAEDAVVKLNLLLSDNKSRLTQRQLVDDQIVQAQQEIEDSNATINSMSERLDVLCREAKCKIHTELEEAERSSVQLLQTRAAIDSIERDILESGEGAALTELELEVRGENPDVLPSRIQELSNKIDEELDPKRTTLAETKGREEKEMELMDGSDSVAEVADEAQAIIASINSNAERYVRVKLAGRILRDEIERYRMENQGPLIARASECFNILTLGSFDSLKTDFNENDEPVLIGIRPNGDKVHVEGMSSGTRDQLYLALRLASLEKYMEDSEPMPFIVDDILIDFDDERSDAALKALSELAQKTQVILFTHHSNVVEQAKKIDGVHIQKL